jgi:hypothetical protein
VPRGTAGRAPALWDLNLRATYDFPGLGLPIQGRLVADVQHIGNPREVIRVDQVRFRSLDPATGEQSEPNENFMKPVLYQDPMTLRIGLEFGWKQIAR